MIPVVSRALPHAHAWAAARSPARERQLLRQLQRFHRRYQKPITLLARQHAAVADLAFSFPAVLFALACPHKGLNRAAVLHAVIAGSPLKTVAQLAGLPFWLKKLPPEAFSAPIGKLPADPAFVALIGQNLPTPAKAQKWFKIVQALAGIGHGPYVAWGVRVFTDATLQKRAWENQRAHLLALWSWYSLHGQGVAAACIAKPWHPKMTLKQAIEAAHEWHDGVRQKLALRDGLVTDFWFDRAVIDGFAFEPLVDAGQIRFEAKQMKNCLATYVESVAQDRCRLWKVVRDGKTEAVLELTCQSGLLVPHVTELRGPDNADVSLELAMAVRRWQFEQPLASVKPRKSLGDIALSQLVWRDLWKPYWLHQRKVPYWLPALGNWSVFDDVHYGPELW
jgi:hypothetical protein